MTIETLAADASRQLARLFSGGMDEAGRKAAATLRSVVRERLSEEGDAEPLDQLAGQPESPERRRALATRLKVLFDQDPEFQSTVRTVLYRANISGSNVNVNQSGNVSASGGSVAAGGDAAGRDIDKSHTNRKTVNTGGLILGAVLVILVLFGGGAIIVNTVGEGDSSGLSGDSTCADFLASADPVEKQEVMKALYLERGMTQEAGDAWIIQNTDYRCGNRPDLTLAELADTLNNS